MDVFKKGWFSRYRQYLASEHWAGLRREVFARDGGACQRCGTALTLDTMRCHHVSYEGYNRTGKSSPGECIALCQRCHIDAHPHLQREDELAEWILESIRRGKQ